MIPFWFLPYALAIGNTFIHKPSERVPLTMHNRVQHKVLLVIPSLKPRRRSVCDGLDEGTQMGLAIMDLLNGRTPPDQCTCASGYGCRVSSPVSGSSTTGVRCGCSKSKLGSNDPASASNDPPPIRPKSQLSSMNLIRDV